MSLFYLFTSHKKLVEYCRKDNRFELLFFILFTFQTFVLPSIPSGFHSPTPEGWMGFYISTSYVILFYIFFYYSFYRSNESKDAFIREVIIFSVVARLHSFFYVGLIAFLQFIAWSFFKFPKFAFLSLIYFLLYYLIFGFLMIRYKRIKRPCP